MHINLSDKGGSIFLARVAVQMGVTQIFWGEFADTEAIRAVCGLLRWCKLVPDCCNAGEQILDLIGKSLSDEGDALVMSPGLCSCFRTSKPIFRFWRKPGVGV